MSMPSRVPAGFPGHAAGLPDETGVRLTVSPGEDVLARPGTTLGELRGPLAELLQRPELRHSALTADGAPVGDQAVVGQRPLLAGVLLSAAGASSHGGAANDAAALRSPWLVARTTGPRAGELLPLDSSLPLGDGGASVEVELDARRRRVRVRTTRGVRAHVVRSTPSGRERRRRVGVVPRLWRPDARLDVAGVTYALHRSGDVVRWLAPEEAEGTSSEPGAPAATALLTAVVPVAGSIALAVALRQPVYALFSLLGVLALVPQLVAAVRRRSEAARAHGSSEGPAASPRRDGSPDARAHEAGADPAVLYARILAAHEASDGAWIRALGARERAKRGASGHAPAHLLPDRAIAVRGARPRAGGPTSWPRTKPSAGDPSWCCAYPTVTRLPRGAEPWSR
jgi:S-DNA-T family DNA segregation ATPase FtsK/SpoIIIE